MGSGALALEAHHTTHIEGTKLSLDESEQLLAYTRHYRLAPGLM